MGVGRRSPRRAARTSAAGTPGAARRPSRRRRARAANSSKQVAVDLGVGGVALGGPQQARAPGAQRADSAGGRGRERGSRSGRAAPCRHRMPCLNGALDTSSPARSSPPPSSRPCSTAPPSSRPGARSGSAATRSPGRTVALLLRAALDPDPGLVRGRGRRARRPPARPARRRAAARPRRVDRRHRPGAVALPARDRDPLGLARDGRRARRRRVGPGDQRAHPAAPPLPGARRPADPARALRRARRGHGRLRRRRQQRRPLAGDPRPHRRGRGPGGGAAAATSSSRAWRRSTPHDPREAAARRRRALHRRLGEHGRRGRTPSAAAPTSAPYQLNEELLELGVRARDRAPLPARPPRRGDLRGGRSTASARRSGTRPRTACTPRRRCSSCSPRGRAPRGRSAAGPGPGLDSGGTRPRGVTVSTSGFQPGSAGSTPAGAIRGKIRRVTNRAPIRCSTRHSAAGAGDP